MDGAEIRRNIERVCLMVSKDSAKKSFPPYI